MADDTVSVKFGASTSDLESGVDTVKSKLGEIASVVAGAFAVDKIAEFVSSLAKTGEEIEHLSQLTGFATDTIQAMQFAIQLAGGDSEAAGQSLARFERNVFDAANGSGTAFEAFQKLGISLDMLQHASPEELLRRTLDGLNNVSDAATRNAISIAIGGRSFAQFTASLHGGSAALDSAKIKLQETNDLMDGELVKSFADLDRETITMEHAFHGLGVTIVKDFIEPLKEAIGWITKAAEELSYLWQVAERGASHGSWNIPGAGSGASPGAPSGGDGGKANRTGFSKPDTGDDSDKQRSLLAEQYEVKKEYDDLQVESGVKTHQEELSDLQTALAQEHSAIDRSFDEQLTMYAKDSAAYQSVLDKKAIADQKYTLESMKLSQKVTEDNEKEWTQAFNIIDKNFNSMIQGMMQGTQTMGQMFQRMAQNLVVSMEEAIAKILLNWLKMELQKTFATMSGNAARVSSDTAAATASSESGKMGASEQILQDAYESAANVYASVSAIPYVGWILAPIAAAGAFATVAAFDSFDTGTPYVPNDMLAQIHQGEAIIPAKTAAKWRDGDLGIGGEGGGGGDTHVHLNVSAIDAAGVAGFMKQHSGLISKALVSASRGGNTALRSAMAGK
jgi:hypothetical protein